MGNPHGSRSQLQILLRTASKSAKKTALSRGLEQSIALGSPGVESLQSLVIGKQVEYKDSTLAYINIIDLCLCVMFAVVAFVGMFGFSFERLHGTFNPSPYFESASGAPTGRQKRQKVEKASHQVVSMRWHSDFISSGHIHSFITEELESPATPVISRRGSSWAIRAMALFRPKFLQTRSAVANRARCGPEITLGEWREYSATQKYRYTAQMDDVQIK